MCDLENANAAYNESSCSAGAIGCLNCTGTIIASMTFAAARPAGEKGTVSTSDAPPIQEGSFSLVGRGAVWNHNDQGSTPTGGALVAKWVGSMGIRWER